MGDAARAYSRAQCGREAGLFEGGAGVGGQGRVVIEGMVRWNIV